MSRLFFFLLVIFSQTLQSFSAESLMPPPPPHEPVPKSTEIKKIAKLLENPQEREKLLKTLKVLAAVQEAEEKKEGGTLRYYIMPAIQVSMDALSAFYTSLKKIPDLLQGIIDFFKIDANKADFWAALKVFPLLVLIEGALEGLLTWFFHHRLMSKKPLMETRKFDRKKGTYAYMALFYAFLYSLLFLPTLASPLSVGNWVIGFWLTLFGIRIFLLERKLHHRAMGSFPGKQVPAALLPEIISKGGIFFRLLSGIILWALLMSSVASMVGAKNYGKDFILNLVLFMSFPLLILYFREWRTKKMPGCLADSHSLVTVPHKIAFLVNFFIQYLPGLLLALSIPLLLDRVFFSGSLWESYGFQVLGTVLALAIFLGGRRYVNAFAYYKIPKAQTLKDQPLTSYAASLRFPFIRGVQWLWHVVFLGILLEVWGTFFSGVFMDVLSYPLVKTLFTIGLTWGLLYLIWLGINFLVQFHTKPQVLKGKNREPTAFAKTFGPMLQSVARWVVVLVAIFTTLESLGFDLKILVYLMSAFAFAISLGSQSLVKDVINGFFALINGSFAVGDYVTVGGHTGMVESLSLRAITLRHKDGALQMIPFSEVGNIINRSRDYMIVTIDAAISYKAKVGNIYKALSETAEEMSQDPVFGKMILIPLSISGIDQFSERAVHVTASVTITPDPKRSFEREFNRRLKVHMDNLKIPPPIVFQGTWE